jgi:hypothetical protein
MYNEQNVCEKITSMYPDIGHCGIDINVSYNELEKAYVVHLKKESHVLNHFLEMKDAEACIAGKQCVALGLEIAQLRSIIEGKQF